MSYVANLTMRVGENEPVFGQFVATPGDTITLQNTPAPVFKLKSMANVLLQTQTIVQASNGGWNTGPLATVLAWYQLDTTSLAPGGYVVRIEATVVSTTDGLSRRRASVVSLVILDDVEIAATFDITTPIGEVRLLCLDQDPGAVVFSDAELQVYLNKSVGVTLLAAAFALEALCTDALRLANAIRIGAYKNTSGSIYQALVERAARYRALAIVPPVVVSDDQVFTNGSPSQGTVGTMDTW